MSVIDSYLDTLFAPYPDSSRMRSARIELRAMMEDAYNDAITQGKTHNEAVGQVITDFGNLHELAPVLGIAQDIQPGGAPQVAHTGAPVASEPSRPAGPAPVSQQASWDGNQDDDPFTNLVAGIYWPAAVVIYLLWSFIFDAWDVSWILWPVAAVAFAIFATVRRYQHDRR